MIVFTHRIFLSTPSARRATDNGLIYFQEVAISIHALCEEGDAGRRVDHGCSEISIHALCEEGDRTGSPAHGG